jgi:hypothetical protein
MLPASLRPKEVEDKTTKDVKQLSDVGEASYMVPLHLRGARPLIRAVPPAHQTPNHIYKVTCLCVYL